MKRLTKNVDKNLWPDEFKKIFWNKLLQVQLRLDQDQCKICMRLDHCKLLQSMTETRSI